MFFTNYEVTERDETGRKVDHFGFYPTKDEAGEQLARLAFRRENQGRTFQVDRIKISIPGRDD